ncbi:hypothetical protein GH741_18470 [Aquibacillus halophilus]|uniref:Uncharacterized protein n=1 Tax=Aquibacillus halophilus TaxID=930132 RepID=A0A6A8DG28_9BACI|nr:hypothetical protein [Aquibacillus halophilus]MRH44635.1 hypothetical protein [Aquibacillus halophilus]
MNSNKIKGLIILGITAILLIVFTLYNQDAKRVNLDETKFTIYDSEENLMAEKENLHAPFSLAREIGFTQKIDKKIPVLELNRTVTLEEAWLEGTGRLIFVYSIQLHETDNENAVPELEIGEITYKNKDGEIFTVPIDEDNPGYFEMEENTVHNNKLYRMTMMYPHDLHRTINNEDMATFFEDIIEISLEEISVTENEETAQIDDFAFSVNPRSRDDFFLSAPVNEELNLGTNQKIGFDQLQIGLFMNRLILTPDTSNQVSGFYLNTSLPDREIQYFEPVRYTKENEPFVSTSPFNKLPNETEIKFRAIQYSTEEKMEATITKDQLTKLLDSEIDRVELAEKNGFVLFLEPPGNEGGDLKLSYEVPELISDWEYVIPLSVTTQRQLDEWLAHASSEEKRWITRSESVFTAYTEEGTELGIGNLFRNSEHGFALEFNPTDWLEEDVIQIHIANLPLIEEINKELVIEIPEYK